MKSSLTQAVAALIGFISLFIAFRVRLASFNFIDPCEHGDFVEKSVFGGKQDNTVLVTGGSGFIGSNLVDDLLNLGYRVRVLDNLETGNIMFMNFSNPSLEVFIGDIENRKLLNRALEGVEYVFHFAAASKVAPSLGNPVFATFNVQRNSVGTAIVLEAANATKSVKKLVYAASSTFYGNQRVPHTESDPFVPSSPYAASKYMGELQTMTYDSLYGLPTVNLRFFMVYGPRQPRTGAYAIVTGKFVAQRGAGMPLTIEGTGEHFRDFVHVSDVARACILAIQNDKVRNVAINVGSGKAYSVKQVADIVSSNQIHVPERPHDLVGTLASTCLAKEMLGFSAKRDFVTEMKNIVKHSTDTNLAQFWTNSVVQDSLRHEFSLWEGLSSEERNEVIRLRVMTEGVSFLMNLPGVQSKIFS